MLLLQIYHLVCWLVIVFPRIPILSIPPSEINVNLIFEHCFKKVVWYLIVKEAENVRGCPYPVAKFIYTLEKYAKISSVDSKRKNFKYKCIYDELKAAFFSLQSEARWEHISSWEVMINIAVTIAMRRQKLKVIEFLDEALIKDNPLAVFGPMKKFSEDPEFLNYKFKKTSSIMSVSEEYEMLVRSTVLKELDRIRAARFKRNATELSSLNGELSQAEIVDFPLLISKHLHCLFYPKYKHIDCLRYLKTNKNMEPALRLIYISTVFPKFTFDAYYEMVEKGDGREEFGRILTAVQDKIHQADPFACSSITRLFKNVMYIRYYIFNLFKGLGEKHKMILDSPEKRLYHLRLEMIAFLSEGAFSYNPLDSIEHRSEMLSPLFDYHVLKRGVIYISI